MAHFDATLLKTNIVSSEIKQIAEKLKLNSLSIYNDNDDAKIGDLLLILNCIDLTTLAGDDTYSNVSRLCYRAKNPLSNKIIEKLAQFDNHYHSNNITTGAVCVYPLRVSDCRQYLDRIDSNLPIASVVAGFPSGQSPISVTLADITFAVQSGANEIDIVINRSLVLSGKWQELFNDIKIIAQHCHEKNVHLKVILSCGELGNLQNIYKASMCAMMAGADFIKTSTGKESINATLTYGLIMIRAITDFYIARNIRVGLKPAGGIKNATEALCWINLVRFYLGPEWLNNKLFRIGASSLLNNIEFEIFKLLFNRNPTVSELTI